jgi:hypothetical protein
MLAVFCLRLALGMLFALFFLSPSKMHPRFFRTHFVTALGLCVVALVMGLDSQLENGASIYVHDSYSTAPRPFLIANVVLLLAGSVVWIFQRPAGGRLVQVASLASIAVALVQVRIATASLAAPDMQFNWRPQRVYIPWYVATAGDLTSAALLGFAITAMLVGHSYLISPALTIRPLMGQIAGLGVALLARIAVAGAALWFWAGDHDITNFNDINVLWLPVRWLVGFAGPLVFGSMAYRTAKIRSTQSATGILYVVVILSFLGELFGLLLTRNTGLPL